VSWFHDSISKAVRQDEAKHSVHAFTGLTITSTQVPKNERIAFERIVQLNGGTFEGDLDPTKCTHLIAEKPEGSKYESVRFVTTIRVMRKEWVLECADKKSKKRHLTLTI
jgi:twin BRCT domain